MATEVLMPRQGQSVESCIIIEWKVNEGDVVTTGQALCEVETDKATFEVEATADGTVLGIFYPAEADVEVLKVIAAIGEPGEDISGLRPAISEDSDQKAEVSAPEAATLPVEKAAPSSDFSPLSSGAGSGAGVSPRAKALAEKKGVDPSALAGSGPNGRVIERDVSAAQPGVVSPAAQAKAAAEGLAVPASGSGIGGRVLASDLMTVAPESIGAAVAALDFPGRRRHSLRSIPRPMRARCSTTAPSAKPLRKKPA
jgi:pyruvate dehydrogenase E2 component (dihydrolipoamide acetyltransferase)